VLQTLDHTEVSHRHARAAVQGESVEAAYPELAPAVQGRTAEVLALIRLLAAGDTDLWEVVGDPLSSTAGHLRETLLSYLALGNWQGWPLSLQAGSRLSHEARVLRTRISAVACESAALGWRATLLATLRDPDPRLRRVAVTLLGACDDPCALQAAVKLLGDANEHVRWAAAVALARHHGATVEAIPRRLTSSEMVPEMRHTAAYVLRIVPGAAAWRLVAQVVAALDSANYHVATPVAADAVLRALDARRSGDVR
jgi:HEAT repeat protein